MALNGLLVSLSMNPTAMQIIIQVNYHDCYSHIFVAQCLLFQVNPLALN